MAKYEEASKSQDDDIPGSLKAMAVLMIIVMIFAIICRCFVCYYLYPIACKNSRTTKDRKQAMKAPLIYIALDVVLAIFELISGLVALNAYKEETN